MNGFHVNAVGWVLTSNAFALQPLEAHDLSELWAHLVRLRNEDSRRVPPLVRFLFPRTLPLSPSSRAALATLVARMIERHPERFGCAALRQRRNHWACQAALGFLLSGLAVILVPMSSPRAAAVSPTFFLIGFGCLLPTVTLWRAAAAVRACSTPDRISWTPLWSLWSRFWTR